MKQEHRSHAPAVALWLGHGLVAYAYVGYPLLMASLARRARPPHRSAAPGSAPSLTVVVPALNEAAVIREKVADTLAQDYPTSFDVLVVADGSSDGTEDLARRAGARVVSSDRARGKGHAINHGAAECSSELICFSDANCSLGPGALESLAVAFSDPAVGVVSGAKRVVGSGARGGGESLYWRYEAFIKRAESRFGVVMGAPGELCAVRQDTFRPIPSDVVNDDYWVTCDALARGWRVEYAGDALALESVSASVEDEAERRARIAMGTWQATIGHARLADPQRGWVSLAFLSHRFLRNLVVPVVLPALPLGAFAWSGSTRAGRALVGAHVCLYGLGALGMASDSRAVALPYQFLMTNIAALRGGWRYVTRSQEVLWKRVHRGDWVAASDGLLPDVESRCHA